MVRWRLLRLEGAFEPELMQNQTLSSAYLEAVEDDETGPVKKRSSATATEDLMLYGSRSRPKPYSMRGTVR